MASYLGSRKDAMDEIDMGTLQYLSLPEAANKGDIAITIFS